MSHRDLLINALKSTYDDSDARARDIENKLEPALTWQRFLYVGGSHVADLEDIIRTTRAEFTILGCTGLFRPAMQALRSYYELSLAWTYYVDHPREWESCKVDHSFFLTPKQLRESMFGCHHYLEDNFRLMQDTAFRRDRNPYATLSKFAHAADPDLVPSVIQAGHLVRGETEFKVLLNCIKDVNGYIYDWYASVYCPDRWLLLSSELRKSIATRLTGDRIADGTLEAFRTGNDLRPYFAGRR